MTTFPSATPVFETHQLVNRRESQVIKGTAWSDGEFEIETYTAYTQQQEASTSQVIVLTKEEALALARAIHSHYEES